MLESLYDKDEYDDAYRVADGLRQKKPERFFHE